MTFQSLTSTFTSTIFSWDYFSDFEKIGNNTFAVKVQLNILNSLLWEQDIESKFLELIKTYPDTRKVLPLLIAVRKFDKMEDLVEDFIKDFCENNPWFKYKEQATKKYMEDEWGIIIESDKASRRFDFALYDSNNNKIYLIEVNYYGWGWSKLKAVAGEFSGLYHFMKHQNVPFFWFTDGIGWFTALNPLEEAYEKMEENIYNLLDLKEGLLDEIIK